MQFNFSSPAGAVTLTNNQADPFILNSLVVASNTQAINFFGGALHFSGVNATLVNNVTATIATTIANDVLINAGGLTMVSATAGTAAANNSALVLAGNVAASSNAATILTLGGVATSANNRFTGIISDGVNGGSLGIVKIGTGTWTLSNGGNTFTGGISVREGTLRFTRDGSLSTGTIVLGDVANTSATLSYGSTNLPLAVTNTIALVGGGVSTIASETNGLLTVSGPITFVDTGSRTLALSGAGAQANEFASLLTDNDGSPVGLQKSGSGVWVVTNTSNNFTGGTTILAGNLRVTDLNAQLLTGGALRFGATAATIGVLEMNGTITNGLGNGAGQIAFGVITNTVQNSGGFSALGGALDVTFNNDAVTPIDWNGGPLGTNLTGSTELQLNSTVADNVVTIHNSFNLGTGTHRIRVTDNILSTADMAVLSGTISGAGGITSTGAGLLVVSGSNSYTGGTMIFAGSMRVADAAMNLNLNATGGNLRFTGTHTGVGGALETSGSLTNVLGTAAGQISWTGSGGFSAFGGTLDVTLNNDAATPLVWGTGGFVAGLHNLVLSSTSADNVVTFHNAINLNGVTGTVRVQDNVTLRTDYAVMSGTLSNGGLLKTGNGLLVLTGVNSFAGGITIGNTTGGGVLRGDAATGLNIVGGGNSVYFDSTSALDGVLETSGTLINSIGTGPGEFRWNSAGTTTQGSGGFSAFGGPLNITLNNNASTPLVWGGTANFLVTNAELQFGSLYSDNVVTFNNAINLGTAARSIQVTDNPDSSADMTIMTGVLSSATSTVGFTKSGTGTLILTADNTFTGTTIVTGGTVQLGNGGATGSVAGNINAAVDTFVVINRSDMLTIGTAVVGAGSVVVDGATSGGVLFTTAKGYTGYTTIQSGIVRFGINNALPTTNRVALNVTGTLDLNDFSGTIGQLIDGAGGAGLITNGGSALSTLTISSTTLDSTFTGLISDGTGTLQINKAGAGTTLTLGGTNTYSGGTTLVSGNLAITNNAALGTGTLRLAGGMFDAGTGDRSLSVPLVLAGTSTITGNGNLSFNGANSVAATSIVTLNNTGTVTINGLSIGAALTLNGTATVTVTGNTEIVVATTLTNNSNSIGVNNLVLSNNLTLTGDVPLSISGVLSASGAARTLTIGVLGGQTIHDIAITAAGDTDPRLLTLASLTGSPLTVDGLISDGAHPGGGLAVAGAATSVLITGSNSFTGGVSIVAGTLIAGNDNAFGTGPLTAVAGFLDSGAAPRTLSNDVILLGTLTTTGDQLLTLAGIVTNSGTNRILAANNTAGTVINGELRLAEDTFTNAVGRILTVSGAGPVQFNGVISNGGLATSGTLSITNTGGVTLAADNTFSGRVTIGLGSQLNVGTGGTTGNLPQFVSTNGGLVVFNRSNVLTYSGVISGTGAVAIAGGAAGGVQFDGANTHTGFTTIDVGSLVYGINNALSTAGRVAVNTTGTLDLNGFIGTLAQLTDGSGGGGVITNGSATPATLTISSTTLESAFSGQILDGAGVVGIFKAGAGTTLALTGSSNFTGGVTLVAGSLFAPHDNALGGGTVRLGAGTLDTGTGNRSYAASLATAGTVTLTGDGNVAFNGTAGSVAVASNVLFNHTGTTLINGLTLSAALTAGGSSAVTVTGDSLVAAAFTLTNNTPAPFVFNNVTLGNNMTLGAGLNTLNVVGALSATGANRTFTMGMTADVSINDIAITAAGDTTARVITLTTFTNGTITIGGTISDGGQAGGGLIFGGPGTFMISGSNTFSGLSTITTTGLAMHIQSDNALGTGTMNIVQQTAGFISNTGTARTLVNNFSLLNTLTIVGDQQLTVNGALTNNAANRILAVDNSGGVVINGPVNLAEDTFAAAIGRILTFSGTGPIKINGVIGNGGLATTGTVAINNSAGVTFANDNTFVGRVTINAGMKLTVGDGGATGNLPGLVSNNAGTLIFNRSTMYTYSGTIGGANGDLVVDGGPGGGVQFNVANTYTGITSVNAGTLTYGILNALPVAARVAVNSTGTVDINGFLTTIATLSDGAGGGGSVTNGGAAANLTLNQGSFSGVLSGNLGLIKTGLSNTDTGVGILFLGGANTYNGGTTMAHGTIIVGNNQALSAAAVNITDTRSILQGDGMPRTLANDFNLLGNFTITGTSDLTLNGTFTGNAGNRTFTVNNTGVTTFGGPIMLSESGVNRALTLALGDGADVVLAGSLINATNTGSFTVTGNNGQVLMTADSDIRVFALNGNNNSVNVTGSFQLNNASPTITVAGSDNTLTLGGHIGASGIGLSGINAAVTVNVMGNGTTTISGSGAHFTVNGAMGNGAMLLTGTNSRVDVFGTTGSGAISMTAPGTQFVVHSGGGIGNSAIVLNNDTVFELQAGATAGTGAITTLGSATFILNGNKGAGNATLDSGAILSGSGVSTGTWTMAVGSNIYVGGDGNTGTLSLGNLVINGGTIRWELGALSDLLHTDLRPIINSTATINVSAADGFDVGSYTLISGYSGTIANINRFNIIAPVGYQKSLESLDGSLILHLTAALTKSWSGTVDNIWDTTTLNFSGAAYDDVAHDAVAFLDGAANTNITVSTGGLGVQPTSVLVNNSATTYTFDGDAITGDGMLSKQGDGLLVILNNNTFTGGIQIAGGTVQLGNGGTTGQFQVDSNIAMNNNSVLDVRRSDVLTLTGNIAGTGGVVMNGTGTLQLAGNNTFFGGTTVNSGAFELVGVGILNEFGGWTVNPGGLMSILSNTNQVTELVTVNGGTLNVNFANAARTLTSTVMNLNGGVVNVDVGNVTAPTVNIDGGALNLNGPTFTPSLLFNLMSGTLNLNASNMTLSLSQFGGDLGETAFVNVGAGMTLTVSNTLTYTANNNAATDPNGALFTGDGSLTINASRSLTIHDSANAEYDLTIDLPILNGQFTKLGNGTLYLKGVNSSTLLNTLTAGVLAIGNDAALGTGTLRIGGVGEIRGDGTPRTIGNRVDATTFIIGGASDLAFADISAIAAMSLTINNSGNTTITSLKLATTNTPGTVSIRGTGTVDFYSILAGDGTGDDVLNFDGQGIYNLRGTSTYTGLTSVRDGSVVVYNPAAFGVSSAVYVGVASATERNAKLLLDGGVTLTNDLFGSSTGSSNNSIVFGGNTAATSTFAGNITFSQGVTLAAVPGGTVNFTGVLDDFGAITAGVTVTGGGTVALAGANAYQGATIVSQGTLQIGSASALGAGSQLQIDSAGGVNLNGFGATVVTLTDGSGGGGSIVNGGAAATLTVGNGAFNGVIGGGANVSLVKNTTGTLILGGANTYTGATLVADGVLSLSGSLASTAVDIGPLGTLVGGGTIAGTVTSSGNINPGNGVGTLTVGALVLEGGGNLNFELDVPAASDKIVITGGAAPVVNQNTGVNFSTLAGFDEGIYTLISGYGINTIDGQGFGNLVVPSTINGLSATLQNNAGSLDLVVAAAQLVWSGGVSNAWNATEANWSGDATVFSNTNSVTFNNTTATNNVVVDAGGVGPYKITVDNDALHNYTFSGGAVSGKSLLKIGVGQLVLANANTFSAGVTINEGELIVGDGATGGSLVGNVLNNALLSFNRSDAYTFAGNISGTGALQQMGTGTLILTGDNSFTGPTTVNFGFLDVRGNYASTIYNNTGVQSTVASNTTGTVAFTAPIVGNVTFQQNGTGVTTLSGANTFTGATQVNAGTLVIGNSLNGTESVAVNSSGTLQVAGGAAVTTPGPITVAGTANFTSSTNVPGTLVVNGTVNAPSGINVGQGGVVQGTGTVNGPLVIGDGGALSPGNSVGAIGGTNLSLTGGSTLVFEFRDASGLVDFNGGDPGGTGAGFGWDLIDLGTGLIDLGDASASDPIFIRVDAWALDNSAHDSGAGGAIFDPNSSYEWLFVKTDGTPLPEFDFPPDDDLARRFVVIDDADNLGVFGTNNAFIRPESSQGQGTFRVAFGNFGGQGNGLYITYSAIPEPGSMILAGLASLGAGWYGRRRIRKKDEPAGVAA